MPLPARIQFILSQRSDSSGVALIVTGELVPVSVAVLHGEKRSGDNQHVLQLMLLISDGGANAFIFTLSLAGLVFFVHEVALLLAELTHERDASAFMPTRPSPNPPGRRDDAGGSASSAPANGNGLSIARGSVGDWCVVADARGTLGSPVLPFRIFPHRADWHFA